MRLAADASALVAEAFRDRGEDLISHLDLDLHIADPTWSEAQHEVNRRADATLRHGRFTSARRDQVQIRVIAMLRHNLTIVSEAAFAEHETEARDRIPRDPNDWPTVALALALGIGIWTADRDFFGCGVPVWTTETLLTHVETGRARLNP
jgi:predicted nucleic acid-binding protein